MASALVASASATPGSGGGALPPIDTTLAKLIVVSVASYGFGALPTVSDPAGNVYTGLTSRTVGGARHRFFYCANPIGGPGHVITVVGSLTYPVLTVWAFSNTHLVPFESENGATKTGTSPLATGVVTPSQIGAIVVSGWAGFNNTSTPTVAGGLTLTTQITAVAGTNLSGGAAYTIQTAPDAINPTWSWTGSDAVAANVAVFLTAVGVDTGAVTFAPPALAGSGSIVILGSGTVTFGPPALSGTGGLVVPARVSQLLVELLSVVPASPVAATQVLAELILALPPQPDQARVTQLLCELIVIPREFQCVAELPIASDTAPTGCASTFPLDDA